VLLETFDGMGRRLLTHRFRLLMVAQRG